MRFFFQRSRTPSSSRSISSISLCLGFLLRGEAADLFLELVDALAQLRFLAGARGAAQIEQLALIGHR